MQINTIRHSLAHILAAAVQELYPQTKFGIGPAIENGFYYDFEFVGADKRGLTRITPGDLPKIEEKMKELIKKDIKFRKKIITKQEAKKLFKGQPYKLELIKELPGKTVSIYKSGDFTDLCKGPHIKSTKEINPKAFKLTKIAGAYWKGDEKNPMLTRIYGVAFSKEKELKDYLELQKEVQKRDHRILGEKLNLFSINENIGPGLILWHPKGAVLKRTVENYALEQYLKNGYQLVATPHIAKIHLWEISGHTGFYKENMFPPMHLKEISREEKDNYQLKPMNCPFHILIYKSKIHSYRDLPLRYTELGTVYRYERSGTLHGLTRVRGFTQDDAHIWCTPEQLSEELDSTLKLALKILKTFGFKKYDIYLSTQPEKFVGSPKNWRKATNALIYALKQNKIDYKIDKGGGVFYGPKIDIKIKDSIGRSWQCTTLQVDFNLPERFKMTYVDKNGKKQQPIMIHRALLGSIERFIGVLIEHYAGAFPFWLAPDKIWIIPIGKNHIKYAKEVAKTLEKNLSPEFVKQFVRILDEKETVSKKIREGETQKIPYLLVVGSEEIKKKTIRIRKRGKGDIGQEKIEAFVKRIKRELVP
ncbi:threonine--tRNA ligase [bacterium]|nr:threonine--tRNA ligase [bacterium]